MTHGLYVVPHQVHQLAMAVATIGRSCRFWLSQRRSPFLEIADSFGQEEAIFNLADHTVFEVIWLPLLMYSSSESRLVRLSLCPNFFQHL